MQSSLLNAGELCSQRMFQNFIHTKLEIPDHVDKFTYIYMNSRVFDTRKKGNRHRLTAEEIKQSEEETMEEMIDVEEG